MAWVIDKGKGIYEVWCRKCQSRFDLNINDIKNHTFTCPICHTDIIIILNHQLKGYHNYGIFYLKLNKKHD